MITALLIMAAAAVPAPIHPPEIETHLAPLVGDWTRAGKEATYRDHCQWTDRHAFVVCSLTDSISGARVEAGSAAAHGVEGGQLEVLRG